MQLQETKDTGLYLKAQDTFNIDLSQSVYIGDTTRDMIKRSRRNVNFIKMRPRRKRQKSMM